jgi:hypothetical protein
MEATLRVCDILQMGKEGADGMRGEGRGVGSFESRWKWEKRGMQKRAESSRIEVMQNLMEMLDARKSL